jgi:hypothetical protein
VGSRLSGTVSNSSGCCCSGCRFVCQAHCTWHTGLMAELLRERELIQPQRLILEVGVECVTDKRRTGGQTSIVFWQASKQECGEVEHVRPNCPACSEAASAVASASDVFKAVTAVVKAVTTVIVVTLGACRFVNKQASQIQYSIFNLI